MTSLKSDIKNYVTGSLYYDIPKLNTNAPWRSNKNAISIKINWTLSGNRGPILILINGFQEQNNPDTKLVKLLSKENRVLMVDIPGFIDGKPPILSFCESAKIIKKAHEIVISMYELYGIKTNLCCFSLGGLIAVAIKDSIEIDNLLMIGTPSGSCPTLLKLLEKPGSTSLFASKTTPGLNPKLLDMLSKWDFDLPENLQRERTLWGEVLNRDHIIGAIPKFEFKDINIEYLIEKGIIIPFERDGDYYQINYVKLIELNLISSDRKIMLPSDIVYIFDKYMTLKPVAKNFIYCHGEKDPLVCISSIRARIPKSAKIITHSGGHFVTLERGVRIENLIYDTFSSLNIVP